MNRRDSDSETLYSVAEADKNSTSFLNREVGPSVADPEAALLSSLPDWLWNILMCAVAGFFMVVLIIYGGRDILLLTGRQEIKASLVVQSKPWDCSSRRNLNATCRKLTYSYVVDSKTYRADVTVRQGYQPEVTIEYVTWAPFIYKKHVH